MIFSYLINFAPDKSFSKVLPAIGNFLSTINFSFFLHALDGLNLFMMGYSIYHRFLQQDRITLPSSCLILYTAECTSGVCQAWYILELH